MKTTKPKILIGDGKRYNSTILVDLLKTDDKTIMVSLPFKEKQ